MSVATRHERETHLRKINSIAQAERQFAEMMKRLYSLPISDGMTKRQIAEHEKLNAERDRLASSADVQSQARLDSAHLAGQAGDATRVLSAIEEARRGRYDMLEAGIEVATKIESAAAAAIGKAESAAAKAESSRNETLAAVKEDLERIGQTIDPGSNPVAAERQFDYLAKQNQRYRQADQEANDLAVLAQRFADVRKQAKQVQGKLRALMGDLAVTASQL